MSDPMDRAIQETQEQIEAIARVREAVERAQIIGNPSTIASIGDLRALLDMLAATRTPAGDEVIVEVNAWVDRMLGDIDRKLPGNVGARGRSAWDRFEDAGGSTAATLPGQALTMVRIGFLGGYTYGWFENEEQR